MRCLFEGGAYLKVAFIWKLEVTENCFNYDIIIIINRIRPTKNLLIFIRKLKQQRQPQLRKRHLI